MKLEEAIKSTRFVDEKHRATVNLIYTAYCLKSNLSVVLKEIDLTSEQHNVLRILKGSHPKSMCVKDIASRMVEKSSNVPRIVDRLVAKKLVKRHQSKEDKRETLIVLTEKGIDITQKARELVDGHTSNSVNLSEEEATTLNTLLEKLREPMQQTN